MASKAWLPYQYRFLEALPDGEREAAIDLAHRFNYSVGRTGVFAAANMERLASLNAKGAMIANTNGPAWFEMEERK